MFGCTCINILSINSNSLQGKIRHSTQGTKLLHKIVESIPTWSGEANGKYRLLILTAAGGVDTLRKIASSYTSEFRDKTNCYGSYGFLPTEGSIMLFPASINHRVTSNQSNEDRISSSFNLTFKL